jgi:hypothetical protein
VSTGGFNPFNPLSPLVSIIDSLVDDLTNVDRASQIHFAKKSTVPYLDGGFLIHGTNWATDRISSMLVLGPMGLTVQCYDDASFSGAAFDVRVGVEMGVAVPTLDSSNPPSFPLGNLTVTRQRVPATFNDCLSSVRMVKS